MSAAGCDATNECINDLANHHIRNALQLLALVPHEPAKAAQKEIVDSCIRRMDWTLREILAGKSKEPFLECTRAVGTDDKRCTRRRNL